MENSFNNIRVFLFKELKKIATLPAKFENETDLEIENRIYAMEKIVKMLKESLDLIDDEIEKNKAHIKSVEEELKDNVPF